MPSNREGEGAAAPFLPAVVLAAGEPCKQQACKQTGLLCMLALEYKDATCCCSLMRIKAWSLALRCCRDQFHEWDTFDWEP